MANSYIPGTSIPPQQRKTYSELFNEQLSRVMQQRQADMELITKRSEAQRAQKNQQVAMLTGINIANMSPENMAAAQQYKNEIYKSIEPGTENSYTDPSQFSNELSNLTNFVVNSQQNYIIGKEGQSKYNSYYGKKDEMGRNYLGNPEDAEKRREMWENGLFESGLIVDGPVGNRNIYGVALNENGEQINSLGQEGKILYNQHPVFQNAEDYWMPPIGDPQSVHDQVVASFALSNQGIKNKSDLNQLGAVLFTDDVLNSMRQEWLRKNPDAGISTIADQPDEWWAAQALEDEQGNKFNLDKASAFEGWKKYAEEGLEARPKSQTTVFDNVNLVDGKPAFAEPIELTITQGVSGDRSLSGKVVRIDPIGKQTLKEDGNGGYYIEGDIQLTYEAAKDPETGELVARTEIIKTDDPSYQAVSRALAKKAGIDDLIKMYEQSGVQFDVPSLSSGDSEKKPPNESPVATATNILLNDEIGTTPTNALDAAEVVAPDEPAEVVASDEPAEKKYTDEQERKYRETQANMRSSGFADFFGFGSPLSDFVKRIQTYPLSMQRAMIEDKMKSEPVNEYVDERTQKAREQLKSLNDQLGKMGIQPASQDEVYAQIGRLEKQATDLEQKAARLKREAPSSDTRGGYFQSYLQSEPGSEEMERAQEFRAEAKYLKEIFGSPQDPRNRTLPSGSDVFGKEKVPTKPVTEIPTEMPTKSVTEPIKEELPESAKMIEKVNPETIKVTPESASKEEKVDSAVDKVLEIGGIPFYKAETGSEMRKILGKVLETVMGERIAKGWSGYDNTTRDGAVEDWCAAFCSLLMYREDPNFRETYDLGPYDTLRAWRLAEIGERVEKEDATEGDLAFLQNREGSVKHVGVFVGWSYNKNGDIIGVKLLGGNQKNELNITSYPMTPHNRWFSHLQRVQFPLLTDEELELISKEAVRKYGSTN